MGRIQNDIKRCHKEESNIKAGRFDMKPHVFFSICYNKLYNYTETLKSWHCCDIEEKWSITVYYPDYKDKVHSILLYDRTFVIRRHNSDSIGVMIHSSIEFPSLSITRHDDTKKMFVSRMVRIL